MNQVLPRRRDHIALEMGVLYAIIILYTIIRRIPALLAEIQTPALLPLENAVLWTDLAEMMFYSAGLLAIYGLISLWLPELRIILWAGTALVVLAGLLYLLAAVLYYQHQGMGPVIQQSGFMFLFSLAVPCLVSKLFKVINKI